MSDLKNLGVMLTQEQFESLTGIHEELRAIKESNEKIAAAILTVAWSCVPESIEIEPIKYVERFKANLSSVKEAK